MSDSSLLPAPWEVALGLRREGLSDAPPDLEDLARCWTLACLLWDLGELRRIREIYVAMWDGLPDDRYRSCGNGQRLRAFLDGSEVLDREDVGPDVALGLLDLQHPRPRPL